MPVRLPETRLATIEGRVVRVIERDPPIPPTLSLLLNGGRDARGRVWRPISVVARSPLRLSGARQACVSEQDHRLVDWLAGTLLDRDGLVRTVRLRACLDCGAVEVRDVSLDTDRDLDPGRGFAKRPGLPWRRRSDVLGWYSGIRPAGRTYVYMGGHD